MFNFSKRNRAKVKQSKDGYNYDSLPEPLQNQIIHTCNGIVDDFADVWMKGRDVIYITVQQTLCHELGLLRLTDRQCSAEDDVWNFFLQQKEIARSLDVIEITFSCMVRFVQADSFVNFNGMTQIQAGVEEINKRFQEHGIGYEFREGRFIRIDSKFLHKEVLTPAMTLLKEPYLRGADKEFAKAHDHLRHHRFGECINECLKAFESTMKAICHKRNWHYNQNDPAKKLLAVCEQNGLFPSHMQSSLAGLRSALESVPTTRNKLSGHGQGVQQIDITAETAAFVLNSTAANIVFLVEREKLLM